MDTKQVRTGHAYDEVASNTYKDFEWAREHEAELLEQYGECVVLVYQQQVIGTGATLAEAEFDAERNLPPNSGEVTPVTVMLHHRQPFFRARPASKSGG